ncbi:unnamed protein product, partial [Porites evermanni]
QKATGILSIFDRDRWFILHGDVWLQLTAFQEMIEQNVFEDYDVIVVITVGSGGRASEIAIGNNYLTGSKLKNPLNYSRITVPPLTPTSLEFHV